MMIPEYDGEGDHGCLEYLGKWVEEMGIVDYVEVGDTSARIDMVPHPDDSLDNLQSDIADVDVCQDDEEVGEPAPDEGAGEDVDGGEVSDQPDNSDNYLETIGNFPGCSCSYLYEHYMLPRTVVADQLSSVICVITIPAY